MPNNLSMLLLPPRSPELNPQENVSQYLRQNSLSNRLRDLLAEMAHPRPSRGKRQP